MSYLMLCLQTIEVSVSLTNTRAVDYVVAVDYEVYLGVPALFL